MAVFCVLAIGAMYEILEWQIAVLLSPTQAEAYNGQQGVIVTVLLTMEHARMQATQSIPDERLDPDNPFRPLPADSPQGTTMPRHISAIVDNLVAMVGSVAGAKQLPDSWAVSQLALVVAIYLGYYLLFEGLFCTTPGKFMNGLVVRDFDGGRCSFRQTLVRTGFRFLEVNPVLLGFLPAAASVVLSRDKQRFGDKFARTVVVFR